MNPLARTTGLRAAVLAALVLALPARAHAQEPMETDRPDFTEGAGVLETGHLQAEGGYTFGREGGVDSHSVGEVLLRVGVVPRVELRIGLNSYAVVRGGGMDVRGVEDASIGVKASLFTPAEGASRAVPAISAIAATGVPTGSDGVSAGAWEPEAKLVAAWELSDRLSLSSNLNYASLATAGGHEPEWAGSVSSGFAISERVGSYAEWFAFFPRSASATHYVNGGVTYRITPSLQLDARAGHTVGAADGGAFYGVGISRRW